ncbi:HK97 family phage major capsid protein [Edaphobacter lichenicola]|uniref:HK97 family phage major capsid protein n=2 Tax=Tunturiibacter gelidiferens TaxID=3069689 RepID=A0A9X0QK39_9BACT|nr:HK97 family phage major capsid protein [Edaphobacter lichenicola]
MTNEATAITKDKTSLTGEERSKLDTILASIDSHTAQIESLRRLEKIEQEQRTAATAPILSTGTVNSTEAESRSIAAFNEWVRYGNTSAENRSFLKMDMATRDLGAGPIATPITGGNVLVPSQIDNVLHQTLKSSGNYIGSLRQLNLSNGGPLTVSSSDDVTAKAVIVGEAVTSSELDPSVSGKVNNTSLFDSQIVKVSYELLNDSAWDIQSWLTGLFNARMTRGVSGAITNGATNFDSLLTAAVVKATTASPILLAYEEVLEAYSALEPAYLGSASWVMHNSVRTQLMLGTTDSFARPLIQPAGQDNVLSLFNRPVLVNQDMTGLVAASKSIIFGDLGAAYTLRSVNGGNTIQRFNELYAGTREVGFRMFSRYSGYSTVQASSPSLVALQQHA